MMEHMVHHVISSSRSRIETGRLDVWTLDVFPKFFGTEEENGLEKLAKEESNY